jgi:hypothetical protein
MPRFCPECGSPRLDDSRFCQNCGHSFNRDAAGAASEAPPAGPEAAPAAEEPASSDPPAGAPFAAASYDSDPAGRPSRKGLLVGVGVVALVAAAGGLWYSGALRGSGASGENAAAAVSYDLMPVAFGDRCGFVDETGKMVINPQFQAAGLFVSDLDLAPIRVGGKWGLIDRQGAFAVNPQFDLIRAVGSPAVLLARIGDKWGIIDKKGAFVVTPQFDDLGPFDDNGHAIAAVGGKWGLIDRQGKFVVDPQFDSISGDFADGGVTYFHDGLAPAQSGDKWGYIDSSGKWVITPQFASANSFGDGGLAGVEIGGQPVAVEAQANAMSDSGNYSDDALMSNDALEPAVEPVPVQSRWGYIDKTGKIAVQPQFDYAGKFSGSGLAPVKMGEVWGFVDRTGAIKINPQYTYATDFIEGPGGWLARVASADGGNANPWRWGAIGKDGAVKIQPQFTELGAFDSGGHAVVKVGENYGLLDGAGKLVVNPLYSRLSWLPGADRYYYVRKAEGAAEGTLEMGLMKPDGSVLSTIRGGLCSDGGSG